MCKSINRTPYHCDRIIMEFHRDAHVEDVAAEAVLTACRTLNDVTLRLDGWEFIVTPHMDVLEVIAEYRKQPAWFVEDAEHAAYRGTDIRRIVKTKGQHATN